MKSILLNPKMRFCVALGATLGIDYVLFRALTANLGPIWGLLAGIASVALIAAIISLALARAAKSLQA